MATSLIRIGRHFSALCAIVKSGLAAAVALAGVAILAFNRPLKTPTFRSGRPEMALIWNVGDHAGKLDD
jgi:hypothetical protein